MQDTRFSVLFLIDTLPFFFFSPSLSLSLCICIYLCTLGRTWYEMHIRTNLHYESDCILSAYVYAYDMIAAHTHIYTDVNRRTPFDRRSLIHSFTLSYLLLLSVDSTWLALLGPNCHFSSSHMSSSHRRSTSLMRLTTVPDLLDISDHVHLCFAFLFD